MTDTVLDTTDNEPDTLPDTEQSESDKDTEQTEKPAVLPSTPQQWLAWRLASALKKQGTPINRALTSSARRWTPGTINGTVSTLTGATTRAQWQPWALAAKLFAIWHSGSAEPQGTHPNWRGGVGDWVRSYHKVDDLHADRILNQLVTANTFTDITAILSGLADKTRKVGAPSWAIIATELEWWNDPITRDQTRLDWAIAYNTYPKADRKLDPKADTKAENRAKAKRDQKTKTEPAA